MARQHQPTEVRRYTTVIYTDRKGKKHTYEIPERYMGYALMGRFDRGTLNDSMMAFMAWWHEQAEMEKAFNRQRAARRRSARKAAVTRAARKAAA